MNEGDSLNTFSRIDDDWSNLKALMRAIVSIARKNEYDIEEIDVQMKQVELQGWQIRQAVYKIWNGQRDHDAIFADLDPNSSLLVLYILEAMGVEQDIFASFPSRIREAIEQGNPAKLVDALKRLPIHEATGIVQMSRLVGVIRSGGDTEAFDIISREDRAILLEPFQLLLQAVAAIAQGSEPSEEVIQIQLRKLDQHGWRVYEAISAILDGERDGSQLTQELDRQSAEFVQAVLDLLNEPMTVQD